MYGTMPDVAVSAVEYQIIIILSLSCFLPCELPVYCEERKCEARLGERYLTVQGYLLQLQAAWRFHGTFVSLVV